MSLKEQLDQELQNVSFSKKEQEHLKAQLVQLARAQESRKITTHLKKLWHGSIEIPLPVAIAVVLVLGIGLWSTYFNLLAVDHATAIILQSGNESWQVIKQGVSIL